MIDVLLENKYVVISRAVGSTGGAAARALLGGRAPETFGRSPPAT
jgi:hypothetical protein